MSARDIPVRIGEVVAEKYRVTGILGRGGMGLVVEADHLLLRQPVAIKFLLRADNLTASQRFRREAEVVAQLRSEHNCRILDVGTLPYGDGPGSGVPYMVLERLEGEDLEQVLQRYGPLAPQLAADFILQAAEVLAEAHALGIVHRDLKPSNLFLTHRRDGSPCIKVLDFGIAKAEAPRSPDEPPEANLTRSGAVMGSPRFMAPEQLVSSRRVDPRTDVWALSVTLYELLSGRPAFWGETTAEVYMAILQQPPPALGQLRQDLPTGLVQVVETGLAKDADARHGSMAALAQALRPFASAAGAASADRIQRILGVGPLAFTPPPTSAPSMVQAPTAVAPTLTDAQAMTAPEATPGSPLHPPAAPALTPPVTSTPATTSRAEGPASHRALWIALAAASILVVGLVATLVWVLLREDDRPSPSSSLPCTYEICDESTRLDFDRPVELGHYLPQAERMAKSSEPKAELVSASITGVVDRSLRRSVGAAVSFSFQYDHGGESGSLVVTVNSSQTILARTISAARVPVVGHTLGDCDFQAALDAAEEAGLQRAKVLQVTYVTQGPQPMWLFQTEEPRDVRYVVGKACHAQATL